MIYRRKPNADIPAEKAREKNKGKGRDPGPRPSAMNSAYERPDYGVSSCFVFCIAVDLEWLLEAWR